MRVKLRKSKDSGKTILSIFAVLIAFVSVAGSLVKTLAAEDSPATGHAQVIAQGVAELPNIPVIWRVAKLDAQPAAQAGVFERVLGFALADQATVLVTDGTTGDEMRLAPGEGLFVHQGAQQSRASLTPKPAPYYLIDFIPASDRDILGDAKLAYASDEFAAPSGRRDLDLVRDVLTPKETTKIAKGFTPTLVLATEGTVKVTPENGATTTLKRGEAATFDAAISAKAVGSKTATFVAAIVGSDTKPVSKPQTPAPAPAPTTVPVVMGGIKINSYACPAGSTIETFVPEDCQFAPDVATWTLTSDLLDRDFSTEDGAFQDGTLVWGGLPLGNYAIWPDQLADGYDDYYIRASAAVARNEDGTTSVTIDSAFPEITLEAYVFSSVG
jgi:hypothetical protein